MMKKEISVVLVDDHIHFRNELATLIASFAEFVVPWQADNGKQLITRLAHGVVPDIVLLDINMPEMDGFETAAWLRTHYPAVKVLAISTYDNEKTINRMLSLGARGFVLKDVEPVEIRAALLDVAEK
ncbi:MAG TPA: response regulator transcription factor [Puia sp.]|nr:response regulator transcription factor [Puia sp.]